MEINGAERKPFLETRDITKRFGETVALDHVDLSVYKGEIRGLIGENGSGKSTISQIIAGIYHKNGGEMFIEGESYNPSSPLDAQKAKIAMIVQESGTIANLSLAENIFLGREKLFTKFLYLDRPAMQKAAKAALAKVGLENLDVNVPCFRYSMETRKMAEIARALSLNPELLIVDETTTALSEDGRRKIHAIMDDFRKEGKAVLFISHDLLELMQTCDCLTVLRDGKLITTFKKEEFEEGAIKKAMVGRQIEGDYYRSDYDPSHGQKETLIAKNLRNSALSDVSLTLHEGEILGIGGLSQSGMHELGKALFGMSKVESGEVLAKGLRQLTFKEKMRRSWDKLTHKTFQKPTEEREYKIKSIDDALKASIGYVAKDRDLETLILPASIEDNLVISNLDNLSVFGIVSPLMERRFAKDIIKSFNVKCRSEKQEVKELSGGNKQKVSFGKWIGNDSKILIFDSPTRGVDVLVKTTMYQLLTSLKKRGYSILIISEELPELIGMSDRILIMKDGAIKKEFLRSPTLGEEEIVDAMI